ncbi:MAG: hypothetical protein OXU36_14110 [Candidatus Poribacteria bacterium]|nr:hypothetical protein [Candidatus Poribacteria bacterium]
MGTLLMLTVGTNPLPVWVALHHLKDNLPSPIHVRLVHTKETKPERDRLLKYSHDVSPIDTVEIVSGNPTTVRNDITQNLIHNLPDNTTCLHVHYTGGTKVMCVETVAAAESVKALLPSQNIDIETSYLDPRADAGATLIDRNGNILVSDTRKGVDPWLQRIAELNGFELGPFPYEYWDELGNNQTRNCPAPNTLNREQLAKGRAVFKSGGRWTPELFEYGAYAAFQDTLADISQQCSDRSNYRLFHKVYVRRANVSDASVKPFELDVVAVLGYQIVVVSCSLAYEHARVKQKGMEAILRMRQLGGVEARAIVLCGASQEAQQLIQAELKEETGHSSPSLEIWGKDTWYRLQQTFHQYIRTAFGWS